MPRLEPLHYYKWLWRDWRSNRRVQKMHYIARGFYRELLDEQFIEGSIPDDIDSLADICGCPRAVMQEYWPEIAPHFERGDDGSLRHPKMESVRTECDAGRVKASEAGKKSAASRSMKAQQQSTNAQLPLTGVHDRSTSRAEQSRAEPEQRQPVASVPIAMHRLAPSPEVETLVTRIIVSHPRSLMRKQRWGEGTYAQQTAVLKAMEDEMAASEASPIRCLEMILARVELHAREVPPDRYQFFKDIERYFQLHEYRLDPSHFNREDKPNGANRNDSQGNRVDAATERQRTSVDAIAAAVERRTGGRVRRSHDPSQTVQAQPGVAIGDTRPVPTGVGRTGAGVGHGAVSGRVVEGSP